MQIKIWTSTHSIGSNKIMNEINNLKHSKIIVLVNNNIIYMITWDFPYLKLILRNHSNADLNILGIQFLFLFFYFLYLFVHDSFFLLHHFLILTLTICFQVFFSYLRDQLLFFLNLLYHAQLIIVCA